MRKTILVIILILLVGLGVYVIATSTNTTSNVVNENNNQDTEIKTIILTSSHFRFYIDGVENPEIMVKQGDKVKIILNNEEGFHDWVVDGFGATERVMPGNSTSVEFIADKKGTFEYYCSVGQHRANGMKGNFIVE